MTGSPPARVRLDVLGRVGLATGGGEARAVLVQPKRVALLVWLALRRPGALVRRDELLGVFWPESTEHRARASLRQALQFLRRHLGAELVTRRGAGELGVNPDLLTCDAVAFLDSVARGDDAAALECYGGDLLPGFLLDGAHEFDRWLNGERQRLRALAVEAALRCAERAASAGDHARAADWLAWGERLEPTDEEVVRHRMRVLERSGNRAAALAAYDRLAQRLRTELDLEPSAATAELFVRIRDAGAEGMRLAAIPSGTSTQRVLVLDLENRTDDDRFSLLGRLASETIARGLADLPDLVVIPPLAVGPMPTAAGGDGAAEVAGLSPAAAVIARRTDAGTLIDGSVHREGGSLWFRIRALDLAGGRLLPAPEPVRVAESSPLEGIEQLRERVVTALAPALTRRVVHVRPAKPPPGLDAYRAYIDGLERFVAGEWPAALDAFRRAVVLAPEYALPRVVSSIALWNLGELREAHDAAREADRRRDALGRFEGAILDMVLAWLAGDWAAAHRAAQVQAELAPGSIPHFQVAEESRRLNHPRQARELLGRLDPEAGELRGWIFYWLELATAHHMLRDHARELEAASRCRQLHAHHPLAALLEARALAALRRDADVMRVLEQLLASPAGSRTPTGDILVEVALELGAHGSRAAAADLMDRALEWHRSATPDTPDLRRRLGRALYYAGRLDEAWSIFEDLATTSRGRVQHIGLHHVHLSAHLDEGHLAAIAARRGDAAAAEHWCAFLHDLDTPFLYGANWFWLAVVSAIRKDVGNVVRMLRRAFASGMPMEPFIHTEPHLAALHGQSQLDAILRPRG